MADLHEAITGQPTLVKGGITSDRAIHVGTECNEEEGGVDIAPLRLTRFVTCGTLMLVQLPCESYAELRDRTTQAIRLSSALMIIDRMDQA